MSLQLIHKNELTRKRIIYTLSYFVYNPTKQIQQNELLDNWYKTMPNSLVEKLTFNSFQQKLGKILSELSEYNFIEKKVEGQTRGLILNKNYILDSYSSFIGLDEKEKKKLNEIWLYNHIEDFSFFLKQNIEILLNQLTYLDVFHTIFKFHFGNFIFNTRKTEFNQTLLNKVENSASLKDVIDNSVNLFESFSEDQQIENSITIKMITKKDVNPFFKGINDLLLNVISNLSKN